MNITTPKGGKPIWVLLICYNDDIIGNLIIHDENALLEFKKMLSSHPKTKDNFGFVEMSFDA